MNQSSFSEIFEFAATRVFCGDGKLDEHELTHLLSLANGDGKIDAQEKAALRAIFDRLTPDSVSAATWKWIREIRTIHSL